MVVLVLPQPDWETLDAGECAQVLERFVGALRGAGHPDVALPRLPAPAHGLQQYLDMAAWCMAMGGYSEGADAQADAQACVAARYGYFWSLYHCCHRHLLAGGDAVPALVLQRLALAFELAERLDRVQRGLADLVRVRDNEADAVVPDVVRVSALHRSLMRLWYREGPEATRRCSDREELILYVLDCAAQHRYRRRGGVVYEQRVVEFEGRRYGSRAWEPAGFADDRADEMTRSSIEAFMHRVCRKEVNRAMWSRLVSLPDHGRGIAEYLATGDNFEFPELQPARNLLSFRNGIYDTAAGDYGVFYDYSRAHEFLTPDDVAARYFDHVVNPEWFTLAADVGTGARWWEIPTPIFQSILDYQNWGVATERSSAPAVATLDATARRLLRQLDEYADAALYELQCGRATGEEVVARLQTACRQCADDLVPAGLPPTDGAPAEPKAGSALPVEAQHWVYVFLGRMLRYLGIFDTWQIIPFFSGAGGTGKSTIGQVAKNFFHVSDVGILSNNCERKFGLQSLIGKFIFLCLELKRNVALDPAEFQSIVSGEDVAVAVKHKPATTVQWRAPGLLCGNEPPGWVDAQGSIARRLAIISFRFKILERDSRPDLLARILREELAALVVKCNTAYREYARRYAKCDIWQALPSYFREERLATQRLTDPLYAVVWDAVRYDLAGRDGIPRDQCFMPFSALEAHYRERHREIRQNNYADPLTSEKTTGIFKEAGIEITGMEKRLYGGADVVDVWLVGIRPRGVDATAARGD